jgi:hypothetical protein
MKLQKETINRRLINQLSKINHIMHTKEIKTGRFQKQHYGISRKQKS